MSNGIPRTLLHALPLAAVFALACALLAPATPSSSARRARRTSRAPQEQEQPKKTATPPGSAVYGRAVYDDTNRPVRRARVMLVDEAGSRPEYNALTDSDGAFRIELVRPGSYFAFVDVPGVLSPVGFVNFNSLRGRGAPDFTEARRFFDVVDVDGKQDARLTVRARRGAALGGKVTYADGDPAVNVTVNVMRRGAGGHLEKLLTGINITSLSGLRTDDRGLFRVSGLPPGEYVVGVSEQSEHGGKAEGMASRDPTMGVLEGLSRQQFLMTFYPSATTLKEAAVVKADAGVERPDIDIIIPERALHTVGGVVRGKTDKRPVKGAKVSIVRRDDDAGGEAGAELYTPEGNMSGTSTATDAQGRWAFTEIPEGPYTIIVKPSDETEAVAEAAVANMNVSPDDNANTGYMRPRRKSGYAPARRDVEVISSDLSDLAVELGDGGRVSGTVVSEGTKSESYGSVSLRRVPDGSDVPGSQETWTTYASEGRFEVVGLPAGKYFLQYSAYGEDGKFYAKSATWNGRDITREPLEVVEGTSIDGVRIEVSQKHSTLRVRATAASRKSATGGAAVFLVPADVGAWPPNAQDFSCTTEDEGACEVSAPPGDYRVVALPRGGPRGEGVLEAELKRRAPLAPRVTLAAGEKRDFEVALPE